MAGVRTDLKKLSPEKIEDAFERASSEEEAILGDRQKVEARIFMTRNETSRRDKYEFELMLLMQRSIISDVTCVAKLQEENQKIDEEIRDDVERHVYASREGLKTIESFHYFEADEGCSEKCTL